MARARPLQLALTTSATLRSMVEMVSHMRPRRSLRLALTLAIVVILTGLAATRTWVGEDAFITFRTVDNLIAGHGLRWNIDERIQTYTHPLWLLIQVPFYALTRDVLTSATITALGTTAVALWILARRFTRYPAIAVCGVLLPLAFSRSFRDYSTSGFENPLCHLWIIAFGVLWLRRWQDDGPPWGSLFLIASLACITRLDTVLLYAPSLAYLAITHAPRIPWRRCLAGLTPLLSWSAFSLLYYGSIFPNTAPAKLSPHFPLSDYVAHGFGYLANLLRMDLGSAVILFLGIAITTQAMPSLLRREQGQAVPKLACLGLGLLAYVMYVVYIGGDFLSGRFWSTPVVLSTVLLAAWLETIVSGKLRPSTPMLGALAVALAALVFVHATQESSLKELEPGRRIVKRSRGHYRLTPDASWKASHTARMMLEAGRKARIDAETKGDGSHVVVFDAIGIAGMEAGSDVTIIDIFGIGDGLISRMKPAVPRLRRIGHIPRAIPAGYPLARRTSALDDMDPELRAYYEPLRLITSGPLFDLERLSTIVAFNLGAYDVHLEAYESGVALTAASDQPLMGPTF